MNIKIILLMIGLIVISGCSSTTINTNPLSNGGNSLLISNHQILHKPLYQFLSTTGNLSGLINANGDYSITPTKFFIRPNSSQEFTINRLIIHIEDTGTFDTGKYGNNIILTNGITIQYKVNNITINLTDNNPIINNGNWGKYDYDIDKQNWGVGNEFLNSRWTFSKTGEPLILRGSNNDSLAVIFNDDLSGLVEHTFFAEGFISNEIIYD